MNHLATKNIDPSFNYALSQVFSPSLVKRLNDLRHEEGIRSLLHNSGLYPESEEWDLVQGLRVAYKYLLGNYRCEYIYKNEIANQLLLQYHNDNSATLLREVASDNSIADIVIINGQTVAYEIKTELDSFDRLDKQLQSYRPLYDCINIVTHPGAINSIYEKVDESVGIIILDSHSRLETVRKAMATTNLFDPNKAVLTLRQSELVSAYKELEGNLPQMGTALIYSFCRDWYIHLESAIAHSVFANALKSRRPSAHQFDLVLKCDKSLRMLFLGKDLTKRYCVEAKERLGIFV